ncbi:MAG: HD domain-containing protein [bacterium]
MKTIKSLFLLILIFLTFNLKSTLIQFNEFQNRTKIIEQEDGIIIKTIYGETLITENVLIELIKSKPMQRLKKIHQYGVSHYVMPQEVYGNIQRKNWKNKDYNRFDHSIGVFFLLKKYGASLEEQITGLLHDVSHTVFSHVGDFLYAKYETDGPAYQDTIFKRFIKQSEISGILQRYKIKFDLIDPEDSKYRMLEQELPNICADRLEYTLHGAFVKEILSKENITEILEHLKFNTSGKIWYLNSKEVALKFAYSSLELTKTVSAPAWNTLIFRWTAEALKLAKKLEIIDTKEIEKGTDNKTWKKLQLSDNEQIKELMEKTTNVEKMYDLPKNFIYGTRTKWNEIIPTKFRGINPTVIIDNELKLLTEINDVFNNTYIEIMNQVTEGWPVRFYTEDEIETAKMYYQKYGELPKNYLQ